MFDMTVGFDNSHSAVIWDKSNISDGLWHHIVAVLDFSVGTQVSSVKFYVDGALQTNLLCHVTSTTSLIQSNAAFPITIGRGANATNRAFSGTLDDFYFYNRPLTDAEILQLYKYSPCTVSAGTTGPIGGNVNVCLGSTQVFSVAPVSNATSYQWYLPGGWVGTSVTNIITCTTNIAGGIISVAGFNACGQSNYSSLYVSATTCIGLPETTKKGSLRVYPIPANNHLTVVTEVISTFELVDLKSEIVLRGDLSAGDDHLDVSHLPSGVYFLKVADEENLQIQKIIVLR